MISRPSVFYVSLDLPAPISVNDLWRPVKRGKGAGMIRSQAYLAWLSEAGYKLNTQRPGIVEGPYTLTITVPQRTRCDIDNTAKAASDLLQAHGVIENDRHAQEIHIKRGFGEGMHVLVVSTREART